MFANEIPLICLPIGSDLKSINRLVMVLGVFAVSLLCFDPQSQTSPFPDSDLHRIPELGEYLALPKRKNKGSSIPVFREPVTER